MAVATGERESFTNAINRKKEMFLKRILEKEEIPLRSGICHLRIPQLVVLLPECVCA